jgi:dolichol kinase
MARRGDPKLELIRKVVHALTGVLIVLCFQSRILTTATFGLLILVYASVMLFNLRYEREALTRIISINRADRAIPGLDILAYFVGCWIVLAVLGSPELRPLAYAGIYILAFADPIAHLVSNSFGATQTVLTKTTYLEGTIAGVVAGTLAAWLGTSVPFLVVLVASIAAMIVEAGEARIGDHHIDDNLTIPIVACAVMWVIWLAFPF